MGGSALSPVSAAVFAALNVPALTALVPGGIHDAIPQGTALPVVLIDLQETETRGFGAGSLPEITLRLHVFSTYAGLKEAQTIAAQAIALLRDQALTVADWALCGRVIWDSTIPLPDEALNGVPCHEVVAQFRIYVEAP